MTVGADGDLFAAKFPVTFQNIRLGIWLAETVFITGSIDFQSQILVDNGL